MIPPSFFAKDTVKDIEVKLPEKVVEMSTEKIDTPKETIVQDKHLLDALPALSLKSVQYRKQIKQELQTNQPQLEDQPVDHFTDEEFMKVWREFADKFTKTGRMLMSSIMNMVEPKINQYDVTIELPNQGSKISFEENIYDLTNGMRKKLNNFSLQINVEVNEAITIKKAFTIEDKYNYFKKINPAMDTLRQMFDLDLDGGA